LGIFMFQLDFLSFPPFLFKYVANGVLINWAFESDFSVG
jgi:hypothetical protein